MAPLISLDDECAMNPISWTDRMMGCWLGKAVGGTLGMPYEGIRQPVDLTYYDPIPSAMLPNDDLDAQIVYAMLLEKLDDVRVDRHVLSAAWRHIGMSADEYGVCKRNLAMGLTPPATGWYDNAFVDGMGAAIRTELWACLAPGRPDVAVRYAYEDACMDHAGDGIYAAQFIAALQSMAFVESDRDTLLDAALAWLPADSRVKQAVQDTRLWWAQCGDWQIVQRRLADRHLTDNFTDVAINLAYIVLGWLAGDGDFGPSICIAVNCGQDTDCTGATLGALLGILNPAGIDAHWLKPIGRELVLSDTVTGIDAPPTLDAFNERVIALRDRLACRLPDVQDGPQSTTHLAIRAQVGFGDEIELPGAAGAPSRPDVMCDVMLPGTLADWPWDRFEGRTLHVTYRVQIHQPGPVRLLFHSPQAMRVYLDGQWVMGRDAGPFVPAIHRAPLHQSAILEMDAGWHILHAILLRPTTPGQDTRWCVGLADVSDRPVCDNWLTDAFERAGQPQSAMASVSAD